MNMMLNSTALHSSRTAPLVIRASSLSGYPDCPRRWAARQIPREIVAAGYDLRQLPNGIGAAVGTAVHAGAALALTEKAQTGNLPPLDVATDCAVETVRKGIRDGVIYDSTTGSLTVAEQQVVRMTRAYNAAVAPLVQPVLVEERLEAQVTAEIIVSGQQDVLAREPHRVRDLKTGKRGNHKPQLGVYALLAKTHGYDVQGLTEDFIERASIKKPQPDPQSFLHDLAGAETAAWSVIRHIQTDLKIWREGDPVQGIEPGDPWAFAANPSSKLCSDRFCPAWSTAFCREHQTDDKE